MISNNNLDVSEITMNANDDIEELTEFINAATDTDFLVEDIDFTASPTTTAGVLSDSLETKKGLHLYFYFYI